MASAAIRAAIRADRALPEGKRSFYFEPRGKAVASVLLLHGYSACPWEVRECGRYLRAQGYRVYGPRLPGHGLDTAAFNRAGRADWLAAAEKALLALAPDGRKLLLVGHSMGGALSAILAARHPEKIERLVLAAPAFRLANPLAPFSTWPLIQWLKPNVRFNLTHAEAGYWTLDYATHRVAELVRLGREASKAVLQWRGPLLVLQASIDDQASRPYLEKLFPRIPSRQKKLLVYVAAEHNVFHHSNPKQKWVFRTVATFLSNQPADVSRRRKAL